MNLWQIVFIKLMIDFGFILPKTSKNSVEIPMKDTTKSYKRRRGYFKIEVTHSTTMNALQRIRCLRLTDALEVQRQFQSIGMLRVRCYFYDKKRASWKHLFNGNSITPVDEAYLKRNYTDLSW